MTLVDPSAAIPSLIVLQPILLRYVRGVILHHNSRRNSLTSSVAAGLSTASNPATVNFASCRSPADSLKLTDEGKVYVMSFCPLSEDGSERSIS
jgi:hypothetical protein